MAIKDGADAVLPALSTRHRPARAGALPTAMLALLCASAGLALAHHHPLAPWAAPLLFGAAAAAFGRWPRAWPLVLPALLPIIGLAPWTGWITFEEWDLLVLAIAAGGYARRAIRRGPGPPPVGSQMSPIVALLLSLYAGAMLVSTARGIADAGGFTFGLFQGYREPMNSLRLAKSLFAALLIYPLWSAAHRAEPTRSTRHLVTGLALGLLATAAAATWERLAFTDLLNFSTDYRTTALFWEMHVGGAALDGMLSLTFPFVVRELMVEPSRQRWLLMAAILPIAAYASLTTFSRAVYLSVPIGVAAMFMVQSLQSHGAQPWSPRRTLAMWLPAFALVAAFAWGAATIFPTSGYRGLIALLGASALTLALPTALRGSPRGTLWLGGATGLALAAVAWLVSVAVPKGAYCAYAGAAIFTLAMLVFDHRQRGRQGPAMALGGFVAVLVGIALVAQHWGSDAATGAVWPVIATLPLLLLAAIAAPAALWPAAWRWQASTAGAMLLAGGVAAAFGGGTYMSERFSTTGSDIGGRIAHWRQGLSMLHGPQDLLFGRGLGRFVDHYAFAAPANEVPGDYRLRHEGDNRFVTLVAGTHLLGWGELLRLSQRIAVPEGPTFVRLDVRSDHAAVVHLEVCLKHLLYDGGCLVKQIRLPAKPGRWQTVKARLDGNPLSTGPWYAPRLVMFSVASENAGVRVDIDNVALMGVDERNQLVNGDFEADLSRWFMTSDRYHLPWHIKNLAANVMFDQGLVGLTLLGALVIGALARMTLGPARAHPLAPGVVGGLAGFLVVGMFDSLLDVPRVAFLFYFLVLLGLTLKAPRPRPSGTSAA